MAFNWTTVIAGVTALSIGSAGLAAPAVAGGALVMLDAQRLDSSAAAYSQYRNYRRGGWHGGGRGAVIAGAVGLGILGAAAVAANRRAYAEPIYDDAPAYGYGAYGPAYDEPVVVYRQEPYPRYRDGYGFRVRQRGVDPAGSGSR